MLAIIIVIDIENCKKNKQTKIDFSKGNENAITKTIIEMY